MLYNKLKLAINYLINQTRDYFACQSQKKILTQPKCIHKKQKLEYVYHLYLSIFYLKLFYTEEHELEGNDFLMC